MSLLDTASLVLTPNAYKEGKLYSVIPSDGSGDFTFTRATTATRVNSDGLVELVPYNLLTWSEQFDNAAWIKAITGTGIIPVVTANSVTAPDGTLTADRIVFNTGASGASIISQSVLGAVGYTFSIYLKSNTTSSQNIQLRVNSSPSTTITITTEWQRFMVTSLVWANPIRDVGLDLRSGVATTADILVWGAQFVEGTNALPYQKTETRLNIPRLDYSLGGCPNILLEPQRTNLALYSSSFDSATWGKTSGVIVTPNAAIAPDGTMTMDLINFTNTNESVNLAISFTSGATYTFSVWLATTSGTQTVGIGNITTSVYDTVTVTTTPQRFTITQNASSSFRYPAIRSTGVYSIFAWGAQIELGSYATSYIPTTTASVTRNNDIPSKTGISSLIGQTEGTIFIDFTLLPNNANASYLFSVSDGTQANLIRSEILVVSPTLSQFRTGISTLGTSQVDTFTNITQLNNKMAISYKLNDVKIFLNGVLVASDTSATIPATSGVYLGSRNNVGNFIGSYYKSFSLWPTALTNDQLAQLTTI